MEIFHVSLCVLLCGTCAFFISRKLKSLISKILITLLFIIVTPLLYFISVFWIADYATTIIYEPFDKEKWTYNKYDRYRYSLDIDTSTLIDGKALNEVKAILGDPDVQTENSFQYDLSKDSWRKRYGLNCWMTIEFENDTVFKHSTEFN